MEQNLRKWNKNEILFLKALFEGSETDAEISKKTHISKATASRIRSNLTKEKILLGCTPVIDFQKISVKLFAMICFEWNNFNDEKETHAMEDFIEKTPETILFAEGESADGMNYTTLAGFSDIEEYHDYSKQLRKKFGGFIKKINVFFIPITKVLLQDYSKLTLTHLEKISKRGNKK